jgi:hypothetical protein
MKRRPLLTLGRFAEQMRKCYPSFHIELGFSRYFTLGIFIKICRPHSRMLQIGRSRHFTCRRILVYGNISLHMIKLVRWRHKYNSDHSRVPRIFLIPSSWQYLPDNYVICVVYWVPVFSSTLQFVPTNAIFFLLKRWVILLTYLLCYKTV